MRRIYLCLLTLASSCYLYAQDQSNTNASEINIGKVAYDKTRTEFIDDTDDNRFETDKLLWSISDSSYYAYNGHAWVKILDTRRNKLYNAFSMEYEICNFQKRTDKFSDYNRDGNMICQLGKYMYSFGGWNPNTNSITDNKIFRSSGNLSVWETLPDAPWARRHCFGLIAKNDTVFVFGGDMFNGYNKDCWAATADSTGNLKWHLLNNNVPWGERVVFGSCLHEGAIYVIGGQKEPNYDKGVCDDIWRSYDGKKWERIATGLSQFNKNIAGSVVSYNGYIYVIGGGRYHDIRGYRTFENTIWRSKNGIDWEQMPDGPFTGKQFINTIAYDNKLFVFFGGNDNYVPSNSKAIWCMNSDLKWIKVHNPGIDRRHACGLGVYKNPEGKEQIVIVAGNMWNDVWVGEMKDTNAVLQYASVRTSKMRTFSPPASTLLDKFHPINHPYRAMALGFFALTSMFTIVLLLVTRYFTRKYTKLLLSIKKENNKNPLGNSSENRVA